MDNSINYEDFLPTVRMSLYGKTHQNVSRNSKKVKSNAKHSRADLDKVKGRNTPDKKKLKLTYMQNGNKSNGGPNEKLKGNKRDHNKELVTSISSCAESFNEEIGDTQLNPSKSELETFQNYFNISFKKESYELSESSENENAEEFDMETFFKTHDLSDLNESSLTEYHSGIDNEFVSEYTKDVKILDSESVIECISQEEEEQLENTINNDESNFTEKSTLDSTKQSIMMVTNKIQETMVISDDDSQESTSVILEKNFDRIEKEVASESHTAEYHNLGDRELVILREGQSIPFYGFFTLKVLYGTLEILGSSLNNSSRSVNVYSPRGSALLCIKNVSHNSTQIKDDYIDLTHLFSDNDLVYLNKKSVVMKANYAAFLCTKLEDPKITFIEKHISQKIFPKPETDKRPQVVFEPTENLNTFKGYCYLDELFQSVNSNTRLMIAGGKGVGKSTLLRYALNRLLNTFDKIRVLDLDPGQSEFTVPGCVSVITITEPVFGPNFTHLKRTDRSLLSNINVGYDPRAYIRCVKSLVPYLESLQDCCPVLINCMGFTQGLGLNIIASAIKYVRPTDIIQIYSKSHSKNFTRDLTIEAVEANYSLLADDGPTNLNCLELNYNLHKVPAMNEENEGWTIEPRTSREINVLAYFGQMMQNGVYTLTNHRLPMYEINMSDIKLSNPHGEPVTPSVVNANIVALCSLDEESNIFVCLGYGIVRGVDLETEKLVVITPEPPNILENVYYLVLGSVFLPPAVYMMPDDVRGAIPYVMEGELVSLGQITKRSYLPVNKK